MTTLDDFFKTPSDAAPHPRLRNWKRRLAQPGVKAELELYRPATALGIAQTDMNLHFTENGAVQPLEVVAWDDDLNTGLLHLGVRSINAEQEAERFTLGLRGALRKAEREFGNGFFNSVLVDLIKDSDLTRYPQIAEGIEHSSALPPNREGKAAERYNLCREMIADAIGGRARELTGPLHYPQDEAKQIIVSALAHYLDERFSISRRRELGML